MSRVLLLSSVIALFSVVAQAQDAQPSTTTTTNTGSDNAATYWTPERMRDAKPMPMPSVDERQFPPGLPNSQPPYIPPGPPGVSPGSPGMSGEQR